MDEESGESGVRGHRGVDLLDLHKIDRALHIYVCSFVPEYISVLTKFRLTLRSALRLSRSVPCKDGCQEPGHEEQVLGGVYSRRSHS